MASLRARSLSSIAERVPTPGYDRSGVTVGVVHFGVGMSGSFRSCVSALALEFFLVEVNSIVLDMDNRLPQKSVGLAYKCR